MAERREITDQRRREIEQGLRNENGSLTFGLVAEEYGQGCHDYDTGAPPPRITSSSYDLGRAYGQRREAERLIAAATVKALEDEQERRHQGVRTMLADKPDVLAEYDARIAEIRKPHHG